MFNSQKFLAVYSGVLTLTFSAVMLSGFADVNSSSAANASESNARFKTLTVQRINIVEPDGTLRMVLTNHKHIPGAIFNGHEYSKSYNGRDVGSNAGMLFYDGDGTESGGLTFGGGTDANGNKSRSAGLSFDAYNQDEMFSIKTSSDGTNQASSIRMTDEPSWSLAEYLDLLDSIQNLPPDQQQTALDQFITTHAQAKARTVLSEQNYPDNPSYNANYLGINDTTGQERTNLGLNPDGSATLDFLDASGATTDTYPPPNGGAVKSNR